MLSAQSWRLLLEARDISWFLMGNAQECLVLKGVLAMVLEGYTWVFGG